MGEIRVKSEARVHTMLPPHSDKNTLKPVAFTGVCPQEYRPVKQQPHHDDCNNNNNNNNNDTSSFCSCQIPESRAFLSELLGTDDLQESCKNFKVLLLIFRAAFFTFSCLFCNSLLNTQYSN